MAHIYTFTASSTNTGLFFGKYSRFYGPAEGNPNANFDPWAEARYQSNPSRQYIASTTDLNHENREFWSCGAYFGKTTEDADLLAHIKSLPSGSITKITLSFSEYAGTHYDQPMYWDTAADSTGSSFVSVHKCGGLKTIPRDTALISGDITDGNGAMSLDVTAYGIPDSYGWLFRYSAHTYMWLTSAVTLTVTTNESYSLSTSAGTGSTITVSRTSSPLGGATGNIAHGAAIFFGDVLKITFTPGSNYSITTHTVNGSTFTSGGSYTVTGNVSVIATATPLKSDIGATDANIGSASTITVTRYNTLYTHTITYSCGSASGTVVTKGSATSISWTVPTSLYAQIPNAKTATCTLTCETFNGDLSLGSNSTSITITAAAANCAPTVSGTVVDTNTTTIALTGDSSTLVRYKSNAQCTISATANNSATISSKTINGAAPASGDVTTYSGVSTDTFTFVATDSRGYSSSATVGKTLIAYIQLTCNPTIYRVTPTGGEVRMDVSGAYYRGSFGLYSNTLTLRVRYKLATSSTWGDWTTITSLTNGTNSYSKTGAVLGTSFDYRYAYDFQVQAYDGANDTVLSTVTKTVELQRGIPIFDWGENDFNFHVPIKLGDTQLTEAQLIQLLALIT